MRRYIVNNANHLLACSQSAAYWMFRNNKNVKIIKNGIRAKDYVYNKKILITHKI